MANMVSTFSLQNDGIVVENNLPYTRIRINAYENQSYNIIK